MKQSLHKLRHLIREDGVVNAAGATIGHARKTVDGALRGTPGYYALHHRRLCHRYDPSAITPHWVAPAAIEHLTGPYGRRESGHLDYVPHFKPREVNWDHLPYAAEVPYGAVRGGDWDQHREPFSSLLMYQGVEQRFVEGASWEETIYFTELQARFVTQGWTEREAAELAMERCRRLDRLHDRLVADGYRSQAQLNGHPVHEVTVTVARDGTLLYNCEGRNRLCLAKVLGIDEIPVLVLVRHREFDGGQLEDEP